MRLGVPCRVETSDMAWEAGGYDLGRFEVHFVDGRVNGASSCGSGLTMLPSFGGEGSVGSGDPAESDHS